MGRNPCCPKEGVKKGPWSSEEDETLTSYVKLHGTGKWRSVAANAGLCRCPRSCRLRWLNYLKPGIKRGNISSDEEDLIVRLHGLLGNRWVLIAGRLPGRTDNEIKNYWNTILAKKLQKTPSTQDHPIIISQPFRSEQTTPTELDRGVVGLEAMNSTHHDAVDFLKNNLVVDPNDQSSVTENPSFSIQNDNIIIKDVHEAQKSYGTGSLLGCDEGFWYDLDVDDLKSSLLLPSSSREEMQPFESEVNIHANLDMQLNKLASFLDLED